MNGTVFDIKEFSLHDGPGARVTVFLKGCPLRCIWCHNPEGLKKEPQLMFKENVCTRCQACYAPCDHTECAPFGRCIKRCPNNCLSVAGRTYSTEELADKLTSYAGFLKMNGGGVTFSGGEPLSQSEFLKECITLCKQNDINVAVETSLIYYNEEIFKSLDFIMADFKIWDSDTHKKYVGVPNEIIKENFKKLNALNIPIIARTPLIPEIEQGIEEISKFLYSLDNVVEYEILPYHPIGNSKRIALGLEPDGFTVPSKEFLKEKSKYVFVRRKA